MRLTADVWHRAEQRTNCLGDREVVLAGCGIPALENMGAILRDGSGAASGGNVDCLDVSNNLLLRLDNFAKLHRLSTILAGGNRIESLDSRNLGANVPNLVTLALSHNNIASLAELQALGKACLKIEFLDLTGNPVTSKYNRRPMQTVSSGRNSVAVSVFDRACRGDGDISIRFMRLEQVKYICTNRCLRLRSTG
jgi:U2 small nuclear ribonucleoprotein A'